MKYWGRGNKRKLSLHTLGQLPARASHIHRDDPGHESRKPTLPGPALEVENNRAYGSVLKPLVYLLSEGKIQKGKGATWSWGSLGFSLAPAYPVCLGAEGGGRATAVVWVWVCPVAASATAQPVPTSSRVPSPAPFTTSMTSATFHLKRGSVSNDLNLNIG